MLNVLLVLPGETDLDEQGRIKGSLDIPLNSAGDEQVEQTAAELGEQQLEYIYCSPCLSAQQTAERISRNRAVKVKVINALRNLDHGLWHGMSIREFRQSQPRVYRQFQDFPETVCPPEGETLGEARKRVCRALHKIMRKHKKGTIAVVVPEPAASILRSQLENANLGDLWQAECRCGGWESIAVGADSAAS